MVEVLFAEASAYTMQSHKMNVTRSSRSSALHLNADDEQIMAPHNVPDVHQFEMTPKKNFCLENSFQFHLLLSNWHSRWMASVQNGWDVCLDASPKTYLYKCAGPNEKKRCNRKVDGDNKYVNALSSVRCIKIYNNIFSRATQPRKTNRPLMSRVCVCALSVYRTLQRWKHLLKYICANVKLWIASQMYEHAEDMRTTTDVDDTCHQSQTITWNGTNECLWVLSVCSRWWSSSVHILFVKQTFCVSHAYTNICSRAPVLAIFDY